MTIPSGVSQPYSRQMDSSRAKILIVDDQPINIQVLYQLFAADYQVFMATQGEQAIKIAQAEHPDVILMDMVMPGLDGPTTCIRIQQDAELRHIPIIFITAHHDPEQEARCLEIGGRDFIAKPINPPVVRARVKTQVTLKQQSDLLRQMAFLDGLTGIFNRRYFDERFAMESRRSERDQTDLSLLLLDVDHFKLYNDFYGHQMGDDCLRAIAHALQDAIKRPGDMIARYGGEEFACLLPDTDLAGATVVAQTMLEAVRRLQLPHEASHTAPFVTLSIGLATRHRLAKIDGPSILKLTDQQLYRAKSNGRNQLCSVELH